jgi:DinB superfamily/Pentapeptide repeats (8 copies)
MLLAMADFIDEELQGSRFENVDLSGSRFRNVDLSGATIRGAMLVDVDIDGLVRNTRINGVDVGPLIEAELDRRHPERTKLRAADAEGLRQAWAMIEQVWPSTVERARRLPPELLHERVDGEWSFIETLRHLVFATDAWVSRAMLGDPAPYDPLDLPHTEMGDVEGVPNDADARPDLDDILALRADRMEVVRDVLTDLTDDVLDGTTEPNPAPGYPAADSYPVRRCLRAVVNEEWLHRLYAERDLAVLESRP